MAVWEFGDNREAAGRALLLAAALLDGPRNTDRPEAGPFGWRFRICGVGLFARQTEVVPAVYIERESVFELAALNWREAPEVVAALRAAFGENLDWVGDNVVAVPVSSTFLHADPGDPLHVLKMNGQFGAPVTWGAGKGFLTAGHVGQKVNMSVDDGSGKRLGTVVFVRTANAIQPQGCAGSSVDVAVVALDPGVPQGNRLKIVSTTVPAPYGAVEVHTRSGVKPARVSGAARWWYVSGKGVTLTEIYLSGGGVTAYGDSGGPVMEAGWGGRIIGHIVSGGAAISCFQDIDHQLAEIRKDPAFATIRL
jgi:hypothetical protein